MREWVLVKSHPNLPGEYHLAVEEHGILRSPNRKELDLIAKLGLNITVRVRNP